MFLFLVIMILNEYLNVLKLYKKIKNYLDLTRKYFFNFTSNSNANRNTIFLTVKTVLVS